MDKDSLKEELKKLKAIQDVSHLEGIVLLTEGCKQKVINNVSLLANTYLDKSENELKAICATLKANLDFYKLITGVEDEVKNIENALE